MTNLLECFTELRETFTYIQQFIIKEYGKGYRLTSRWKGCVGQGGWEEVWSFHAPSRPTPLHPPAQYLHVFTSPEALRTPDYWSFIEASSRRLEWSLTPFPALFPSQENERQGWKFQASNHGFVFPMTSPHPGATQSRLLSKDQILGQKILLMLLPLRKLQGF